MEANLANKKFSAISLFSGAGGMDLGFKLEASFNLQLANDILSAPASTYAENFGNKIIDISEFNRNSEIKLPIYLLGDVSEIDFRKLDELSVDIVVGGPPCQDFSVVRGGEKERQGIKVKRGRLYSYFIRALTHLQPEIFVFENVPGLKSANNGAAYETILNDFSKLDSNWQEIKKIVGNNALSSIKNYFIVFSGIVDSANLGIPQRRKRLIIIGIRQDLVSSHITKINELKQKVNFILNGQDSLFKKYPLTPLEVFEGKPLPDLKKEYKKLIKEYCTVAEDISTQSSNKWKQEVWNKLSFNIIEDYLKANNAIEADSNELEKAFKKHAELLEELGYYHEKLAGKKFQDNSNIISMEAEEVLERLKMIPPGENHEFVSGTKWNVEGRGLSLIYRRIHPLKPSYTVVAYGGGGTWGYHYERDRGKLTNRERARIQTFPDYFSFKGSSTEMRAQIGEAVPPLLAKKIAEIVKRILNEVG